MPFKIIGIPDSMICKTRLPGRQTRPQSERESSLDELNRSLQRYLSRRRNQRMKMVGHDHEIMQEISALFAIVEEDIDEQIGGGSALE
jgi:hypothetical protein